MMILLPNVSNSRNSMHILTENLMCTDLVHTQYYREYRI